MNAATSPNNSNKLLYVHDSKTKTRWLIDGGAVLSIIPPTLAQRLNGPTATKLQAANGTQIKCYGIRQMTINLVDRAVKFPVTIADVSQPILGSDFLAHAYLAPNHRDGTLIDLRDLSQLQANFDLNSQPIRVNLVEQAKDPCYQLLDNEFPSLSNPTFRIKEVDHGVRHFIPTDGPPVQSKARRLSPEKLAVAKQEIEKLVELGVCERGKSNWSSPLLVTTKPCGSPCTCSQQYPCGGWRVCGDYRRLNNMTTTDRYPVRNLQDFNNDLRGMKFFSKVDLLKGYHQIPVNDGDIKKTAVITPFSLFLFPQCPFGLKNAGQDFQRLMDEILGDIPHVFVYIDDILIASETLEEHLRDLRTVFSILQENGLVVNRKKCELGKSRLEFLGHLVDENGIRPSPEKVDAILATKEPTSIKQLQRFHGMVNYYRRFIRQAAHHLCALFDALQGKPKKLEWSEALQKSFEAIKIALATAAMLHHPDPSLPLALTTDASDVAMGGVVEQRGPKGWEPLAFFSKKFEKTQKEWCPYDRELNAVHKAIRHFKHMLEGRTFTIYTDHQSLIPSLGKKTDAPTARQTNQLSEIAEYSTDIRYLEGKSNFVADCLSRPNEEERKTASVSNIHLMPEVHPFRQAILALQRNKQPEDQTPQSSPDSTIWDDSLEERMERLMGKPSIKKEQPTTTKTVSFADSPLVSAVSVVPDRLVCHDVGNPKVKHELVIPEEASPDEKAACFSNFLKSLNEVPAGPASSEDQPQLPIPMKHQQKERELQTVVNAIAHYDLDLVEMARLQVLDPEFQRMSREAQTGLNFKKVQVGDQQLFVDISNGPARPFVPAAMRRRVFDIIHGLGHPGVARTRQAITAKFVWPNVNAEVSSWARQCIECQRAKIHRHTVTPIGDFVVPAKRFSHIHVDLVTMPHSNGFSHLLTVVDRHSRWPAAIPVKDIAADTVIDALNHGWIAQHGVPEVITTDRGSQFTSTIWTQLLQHWGIKHSATTAYHPEANGMVERLHRRLKESLMALGNQDRGNWFWRLPMTLLALRTTVKPDLGASPSDLVYGEGIAVPGQILPSAQLPDNELLQRQRRTLSNLRMEVERMQPVPTSAHRRPAVHVPDELDTCTHVFVLRGGVQPTLTTPYDGPFRVVERTEAGIRVEFPGRPSDIVAKARLRPAIMAAPDQAEDNQQDFDDAIPPSPPPPGRRPGPRTRIPEPTDRVTRSTTSSHTTTHRVQPDDEEPIPCGSRDAPGSPLSSQASDAPPASPSPRQPDSSQEPATDPSSLDPFDGHVPADPNLTPCPCDPPAGTCLPPPAPTATRAFTSREERNFSNRGGPVPAFTEDQPSQSSTAETRNQGGARQARNRVLSFSNPRPGNFSFRRRRPDVSALNAIIRSHLS